MGALFHPIRGLPGKAELLRPESFQHLHTAVGVVVVTNAANEDAQQACKATYKQLIKLVSERANGS